MIKHLLLIALILSTLSTELWAGKRKCSWKALTKGIHQLNGASTAKLNPYQSFIVDLIQSYHPQHKKEFITSVEENPTLQSLRIENIVAKELRSLKPRKIEPKVIVESIDQAIKQKASEFETPSELLSYMRDLEAIDYPKEQYFSIASNTRWHQQLNFKKGFFKQHADKSFAQLWELIIREHGQETYSFTQFQNMMVLLKNSHLGKNDLIEIINQTPFIRNLKQVRSNLTEQLNLDLNLVLAKNSRNDIAHILDNFELYIRIIKGDDLSPLLAQVESSQNFFTVLDKLIQLKQQSLAISELPQSNYAQRIGLTEKHLRELMLHASLRFNQLDPEVLHALTKNLWPKWKSKNLSQDYYEQQLFVPKVKSQSGWGSCWVHSPISKLEIILSKKLGRPITLSVDYIYYHYLLNEYKNAIYEIKNPRRTSYDDLIGEGSSQHTFYQYLDTYGIIPESAWQPKLAIHDRDNAHLFQKRIKRLLLQYHSKKISREQEISYFKELDAIAEDFFGKPPESFVFNGKTYTPQSFAQEMVPPNLGVNKALMLDNGVTENTTTLKKIKFSEMFYNQKDMELEQVDLYFYRVTVAESDIHRAIISNIENGTSLTISTLFPSKKTFKQGDQDVLYIDNKTGRMTAPEKLIMDADLKDSGFHAMEVVGYEPDIHGNIASIKILNSHGAHRGDRGFYHMDWKFLRHFLRYLFVTRTIAKG